MQSDPTLSSALFPSAGHFITHDGTVAGTLKYLPTSMDMVILGGTAARYSDTMLY